MRDPNITGAINWPPGLAATWPHEYTTGATEPWTQQVVAALLNASFQRSVLELGCYLGHTAVWLCTTLQRMGGGKYLGVDIDPKRQAATIERLGKLDIPDVEWNVVQADAFAAIESLPRHSIGFVWVDDDHTPAHVARELELLHNSVMPDMSKVVPGGIICMHDVCGGAGQMTPLKGVCIAAHGYTLEFPRIGLLGGLGIIQTPVRL